MRKRLTSKVMTHEQRKLADDNHNLIYEFIARNSANIDEFYDVAAIGLCKAAMSYDETKSKFSTYAFKVMQNELWMQLRTVHRKKDIPECALYYYNDTFDSEDNSESRTTEKSNCIESNLNTENTAIFNVMINKFIDELSPRDKRIVYMNVQGYTQHEIAGILGKSQSHISKINNELKNRFNAE